MWNPEIETLPRERMEALQLERLRAAVARVLARVPPLGDRLRAAGITSSDDIRSLADLRRLPFTRKIDLREHYPFGRFAVPVAGLVRIHASSGTRQADDRRLHPQRSRDVVGGGGAPPLEPIDIGAARAHAQKAAVPGAIPA